MGMVASFQPHGYPSKKIPARPNATSRYKWDRSTFAWSVGLPAGVLAIVESLRALRACKMGIVRSRPGVKRRIG